MNKNTKKYAQFGTKNMKFGHIASADSYLQKLKNK